MRDLLADLVAFWATMCGHIFAAATNLLRAGHRALELARSSATRIRDHELTPSSTGC
jgi:hypothetical protein